jgi:hypothetical protein
MSDKQVKFTALLDEKTYDKLRKVSFKYHVSISRIIRQALSNFFLKEDLEELFKEK